MKKFKKGLVCCILALTLVFSLTGGISISADEEIAMAKISEALKEKMASSETVQIFVWLKDSIKKEDVQAQVFEELKIGEKEQKLILGEIEDGTIDDDLLNSYIERKNDVYSELYIKNNSELVSKYFKDEKCLFMSVLTPMAVFEVESSKVEKIAQYEDVKLLDLYEYNPKNLLSTSLSLIQSNTVNNTYEYTGAGVKIGQVEVAAPDYSVNNVVVRNENAELINYPGYIYYTDHATLVAGIINSVAPDAKIYSASTEAYYTLTNICENAQGFTPAVEWLITTHNIINSSCTPYDYTYFYDSYCLWADHISINHDVHFVQSAGNDGGARVCSPGMAYNVITVGNLNDNNSLELNDDILAFDSSYSVLPKDYFIPYKPDLVAPGTNITYNGITNTGTSFAAPHVTGAIALMCEQKNTLKVQQRVVKAVLAATTNSQSPHYYSPADWDYLQLNNYSHYGAGILNCKNAYTTVNYSRYFNGTFSKTQVESETVKTHSFNVTSGMTHIRVALAYLSTVNGYSHYVASNTATEGQEQSIPNLNIKVYYGNTPVDTSASPKGNIEIIDFDPRNYGTGTYTIKVYPSTSPSDIPNTTYYTVAWW